MLFVEFENYRNDHDKETENRIFVDLQELKKYLVEENVKRSPRRDSSWWKNPVTITKSVKDSEKELAFFRTGHNVGKYALEILGIHTEKIVNGVNVTVFEKNEYCSPKLLQFFKELKDYFDQKPIYGEIE